MSFNCETLVNTRISFSLFGRGCKKTHGGMWLVYMSPKVQEKHFPSYQSVNGRPPPTACNPIERLMTRPCLRYPSPISIPQCNTGVCRFGLAVNIIATLAYLNNDINSYTDTKPTNKKFPGSWRSNTRWAGLETIFYGTQTSRRHSVPTQMPKCFSEATITGTICNDMLEIWMQKMLRFCSMIQRPLLATLIELL